MILLRIFAVRSFRNVASGTTVIVILVTYIREYRTARLFSWYKE